MLEVRLLGQFDVRLDGRLIEIPSRPSQSLLAYLILHPRIQHRREMLAGMLWPDSDEKNARNNLRHALWRLRKSLKDRYIEADRISVLFIDSPNSWLDVDGVLDEKQDGDRIDDRMGSLSAYAGDLLPGFYDEWVVLERERLRAVFERRIDRLLEDLFTESRWPEVVDWSERWIALGQVPEPAYRAQMRAYAALGDSGGIGYTFERCKRALDEELDLEPSEATQTLYEWLIKGGSPTEVDRPAQRGETRRDSEAAIQGLVARWLEQGVKTIDLAGLAMVHAAPREVAFNEDQVKLLIRSALEHKVDLKPWLARAPSPGVAVAALQEAYESSPPAGVRREIVEGLAEHDTPLATEALLNAALNDEAPSVRAHAAVTAARRGRYDELLSGLEGQLDGTGNSAALEAFVALADEMGMPDRTVAYPRAQVWLLFLQKRWQTFGPAIRKQARRGALGSAIALALLGATRPAFIAWFFPEDFRLGVEVMGLPVWILLAALAMATVGGFQGWMSALTVGLADAITDEDRSRQPRLLLGALAGLVHTLYLLFFTLFHLFEVDPLGPVFYIPAYVIYGLLFGAALSYLIPTLGSLAPVWVQVRRSLGIAILLALLAVPAVFLTHGDQSLIVLPFRIAFAFFLTLGLGLALSERRSSRSLDESAGHRLRVRPSTR